MFQFLDFIKYFKYTNPINFYIGSGMVAHAYNLNTMEAEEGYHCKCEDRLDYMMRYCLKKQKPTMTTTTATNFERPGWGQNSVKKPFGDGAYIQLQWLV